MTTRYFIIDSKGKKLSRKVKQDSEGLYVLHMGCKAYLKEVQEVTTSKDIVKFMQTEFYMDK